jgi:DNA (cytosine-5)-methyltransferase 1
LAREASKQHIKSFVPQNRERIFIAGFREPNDFTFDNLVLPDPLNGPKLKTIFHPLIVPG